MTKWEFEHLKDIYWEYKQLPKPIKKKVTNAIKMLANCENPAELGSYKRSMGVFSYELGRKYRILYRFRTKDKIIELIRVGDHKQAYGKD